MIKNLSLLIFATIAFNYAVIGQVLETENMEGLNIGIISNDIEEETPGQGGYYVYAPTTGQVTNSGPENFQIIQGDEAHGKVLQVIGCDWGSSSGIELRRISKWEFSQKWPNRTPGNNLVEVKYEFFTGDGTTQSENHHLAGLSAFNIDIAPVMLSLCELCYQPKTRTVWGQVYRKHSVTEAEGNHGLYLGPNGTDVILPKDTWVSVTLFWDYNTGIARLLSNYFDVTVQGTLGGGRVEPDGGTINVKSGADNTAAYSHIFDNWEISAIKPVSNNEIKRNIVSVYPNPSDNIININTNEKIVKTTIYNSCGKEVVVNENVDNNIIDVKKLKSGLYFLKVETDNGNFNSKFFKK